jgi:Protein of unknown function (DUF4058)
MPSPFPGMDPFLEDPAVFPDLHDRIIFCLSDALNAQLPPPYFAGIASRVWVEASRRRVGPDVNVLRPQHPLNGGSASGGGGVAVATEPVVVKAVREEVRETFLEIHAQPGGERLVTTIEVLSLANKTLGGHGRTPYLQKQSEILDSQVHLIEIDLLRGGVHTTAVPIDAAIAAAGFFDYHVSVRRWDVPECFYLYPIPIQGRLPVVAVPLLPDDAPVRMDLKEILDRAYDSGQYRRRVHYREPPPAPPLHPAQTAWIEQVLHAADMLGSPAT